MAKVSEPTLKDIIDYDHRISMNFKRKGLRKSFEQPMPKSKEEALRTVTAMVDELFKGEGK